MLRKHKMIYVSLRYRSVETVRNEIQWQRCVKLKCTWKIKYKFYLYSTIAFQWPMSHACSRHEHVQNIYTDMTEWWSNIWMDSGVVTNQLDFMYKIHFGYFVIHYDPRSGFLYYLLTLPTLRGHPYPPHGNALWSSVCRVLGINATNYHYKMTSLSKSFIFHDKTFIWEWSR